MNNKVAMLVWVLKTKKGHCQNAKSYHPANLSSRTAADKSFTDCFLSKKYHRYQVAQYPESSSQPIFGGTEFSRVVPYIHLGNSCPMHGG